METRLNSQPNQEGISELYSILGTLQAEHKNIKTRITELDKSKEIQEQDIIINNDVDDSESDCISRE